MRPLNLEIKAIIKFKLYKDTVSLDPNISTSLGQQDINGHDFLEIFQEKLSFYKFTKNALLDVLLKVYRSNDYSINIEFPTFDILIKRSLYNVNKFGNFPGNILKTNRLILKQKKKKKILHARTIYSYNIWTSYMLYEIILYKIRNEKLSLDKFTLYNKVLCNNNSSGLFLLNAYLF